MTGTLRERIAAEACHYFDVTGSRSEYFTDAILALFRDEAPPSDEELVDVGWQACGGEQALKGALDRGDFDEADRLGWAHDRAVYDLGHARGIASGEAERAELQSECANRKLVSEGLQNELDELERERDAELAELQRRLDTLGDLNMSRGDEIVVLSDKLNTAASERDSARDELREVGEALAWAMQPGDPGIQLWRFYGLMCDGTPAGIVAALREAAQKAKDPGAVT